MNEYNLFWLFNKIHELQWLMLPSLLSTLAPNQGMHMFLHILVALQVPAM